MSERIVERQPIELAEGEELVDVFAENSSQEEPVQEQPQAAAPEATPEEDLPEKFRGKTAADIAKSYKELESLLGRQAKEMAEVRKMADQLIQQQLQQQSPAVTPDFSGEPDIDFFADPKQALRKTLEETPEFKEVQQLAREQRRQKLVERLNESFEGWQQEAQSPEFAEFVKSSQSRVNLYARAEAEFDYDAAETLIAAYRTHKARTATAKAKTQEQMKTAMVDTTGTGVAPGKKLYRASDLRKLMQTDRKRYNSLMPEIMKAYSEGRVINN